MPGRNVNRRAPAREEKQARRLLSWGIAALALVSIGIAIGSGIAVPRESSPHVVDGPPIRTTEDRPAPPRRLVDQAIRTPAGAVAAATRSITAFDGDVLLDPRRLHTIVGRIASAASRGQLAAAFDQASVQTRAKLGADTVPKPVIVLRSVPVGYRLERFSADEATVAVWYVGIVGSGAGVEPQQSWRTQIVALVWEPGGWKVRSFDSRPGPTPPLATAATESPGELFAAIPRFQEFERAER